MVALSIERLPFYINSSSQSSSMLLTVGVYTPLMMGFFARLELKVCRGAGILVVSTDSFVLFGI
jgi:hypothetical protein